MTLWRVSSHTNLTGAGGLKASGRWHTRGRRILYCAPNPSTALLEVLVHLEIDVEDVPLTLNYLEIVAPDDISETSLDLKKLPPRWRERQDRTQAIGDEWLRSAETALLRVPSALVPETWNTLVNPAHPDSKGLKIARVHKKAVDPRLID